MSNVIDFATGLKLVRLEDFILHKENYENDYSFSAPLDEEVELWACLDFGF